MGIKWDDVHVMAGAISGEIYVGKMKKDKHGLGMFSDKSTPKTEECVKAVMEHMLGQIEENGTMAYVIEDVVELRITDLRKKKQNTSSGDGNGKSEIGKE